MGKKEQRTKGNTKAASSARSAQQLGDHVGFVGFGTATESAFVPLLQGADTDDGVPGDFRLALRKMHKKDVITKVKALQEFLELAGPAEAEVMLSVLPYWPSVYTKLATDSERRVRELAHTALAAVVRPVGRSLGPHLRAMAGAWFLGQADPHTLAANAAVAAWQAAFPDAKKQAGALAFCQAEILAIITDNLTVATAHTLSDPKCTPVEEMEAKHVRTLAVSLASLARLLAAATPAIEPHLLDPVLDHQKFWKLAKHKMATVRQAFFELLVQLGSIQPGGLAARGKAAVAAVLPGLLETDPAAATAVWAAALQVLTVVPAAWDLTSPHKAVFPAVFKFISAPEGLASATFPSLLPFLSKVPVEVMGDQAKFLNRWFEAHGEALAGARGAGELAAIVRSYVECVMFVLGQAVVEEGVKTDLLAGHLLPLVVRAADEARLGGSGLPEVLGPLLAAWGRGGDSGQGQLGGRFWTGLEEAAVARVEGEGEREAQQVLELLAGLRPQQGEMPELDGLVGSLWRGLAGRLGAGERVASTCRRLATILRLLAPPGLRAALLPQGEEAFLEQVLPLLATPSHRPAACTLLWTVGRALPAPALAALLARAAVEQPGATQDLLAAAGRGARTEPAVASWLATAGMLEYALGLLDMVARAEEGADTTAELSALHTVMAAGLQVTETRVFERVVATIASVLPPAADLPADPARLETACRLIAAVQAGNPLHLWHGPAATQLLLSLYTRDDGSAGPELQAQLEEAWLRGLGGGLEHQLAAAAREELAGEGRGRERLLAKCILAMDRLGDLQQAAFILALVPEAAPGSLEQGWGPVVAQEQYSTTEPCHPAASTGLARPRAALLLARLLLHRLQLPGQEGERRGPGVLGDEDQFDPLLAEAAVCLAHTGGPATGGELGRELEAAAGGLVSQLERGAMARLQRLLRGRALSGEAGPWAAALVWTLRIQHRWQAGELQLAALLPRVDSWRDGELATAAALLRLAASLGQEGGMVGQTLGVEAARLVSLGGPGHPAAAPSAWLVACCLRLASPAQARDLQPEVAAVLATLPAWRAGQEDHLLYSRHLAGVGWPEASIVATVADLLASAVTCCPGALSPALWDLASCSLVSWAASLEETGPALLQEPGPATLAAAVARLGAALGRRLGPPSHGPALAPPPAGPEGEEDLPPRLREEWTEFFSDGVFSALLRAFVSLAGAPDPAVVRPVLQAELGAALVRCPAPLLLSAALPPLHLASDVDCPALPDSLTFLYNHLGPLLLGPGRAGQVTAAHLLAAVAPALAAAETEGGDEEEERAVPARLVEALVRGGAGLGAVLADYRPGEPGIPAIPPGCAAHTAALGFLLAWRVVLALVAAAGQELRPRYSEFLRAQGHLPLLLDHLFRLLPASAASLPLPELLPAAAPEGELEALAGSCWIAVCRHLPALARQWWQALDRPAAAAVERLTSGLVTPLLWREETRAIDKAEAAENMSLRVRDSVREVVATYTIDEGSMELVVTLPANHPLGGLTVESGKRVGVETGQWRKWMLQLTTFLTNQNGTIMDGLNLWKRNMDKRFKGVEECYICFYVLHGSNHQLPKLGCRTCKKKFHAACLFKWFATSNNSSCPLCRNLF